MEETPYYDQTNYIEHSRSVDINLLSSVDRDIVLNDLPSGIKKEEIKVEEEIDVTVSREYQEAIALIHPRFRAGTLDC